jgi:hypothetical protein
MKLTPLNYQFNTPHQNIHQKIFIYDEHFVESLKYFKFFLM